MIPQQDGYKLEQVDDAITDQGSLPFKINLKNCLLTIGHFLEGLILAGKNLIKD